MAETKNKKVPENRKIVSASTGEEVKGGEKKARAGALSATTPEGQKKAKTMRFFAVVLWVVGFALEALAYFLIIDYFHFDNTFILALVALGVDLVAVIIGSQLWKRANDLDPASKQNKLKFWLWNNLGVFASLVAFLPFIILILSNKEMDGKNKKVAAVVALIALIVSGVTSYDFNPVSAEDKIAAQMTADSMGSGDVYWTRYGKKYHFYDDCSSLSRSEVLTMGTVNEAFEAGRDSLCKICEKRADNEGHLHTGDDLLKSPEDTPEDIVDEPVDEPVDEVDDEEAA